MLRSLASAISALRNHQVFLDIVSTNISNINTVGYKASRISFQDLLSQSLRLGSPPQAGTGGLNPIQVGLGMQLGGIDMLFTQGNLRGTGKSTDLAIQGSGFFVLQSGTDRYYSRDGTIDVGLDGMLVNVTTGMYLMGWQADATGAVDTSGPLSTISIPFGSGQAQASSEVTFQGNLNLNHYLGTETTVADTVLDFSTSETGSGQTALSSDTYHVEVQDSGGGNMEFRLVDDSGTAVSIYDATTDDSSYTSDWQDVGDMLTNFTDGVVDTGRGLTITFDTVEGDYATGTQAGSDAANVEYVAGSDEAVSTSVAVYDSLGQLHTLTLTFEKTDVDTWTWTVSESDDQIDSLTPATGTIDFNSGGGYSVNNAAVEIAIDYNNGATDVTVMFDFDAVTQLSGSSGVTPVSQDGVSAGTLVAFSFSDYGEVLGLFSNGLSRTLGQISLASFSNPGGLLRMGRNLFSTAANSGLAQIGLAGQGDRGMVSAGFLEMSNVDMAREFTDMIIAQRGFQANSRVVSVSDDILQEVVNLKR